ncbi:salicylic acid-binding 2-like [Olea europaea subsp. europaea]|uniref:Salicylic acid-binding 2-like n=1 Tax=Olea europaea subsp. europaea TaxID=158383 RepID=A0A8S0Q3N7_OLEEU|nr:salicylic acid-binding 2-like [Olea europaea subsp. europaea]
MENSEQQKHFVLVHGACHGAWCWYKVVTLLRSKGHRVTALDMAAAGVHPKRLEELASFSDYCNPLLEFMAALMLDDRVILVGHSLGGFCISLAMERYPQKIEVAVFISSFVPSPDTDMLAIRQEYHKQLDYMDSQLTFANEADELPMSLLFGPKFLSSQFYQLSPPEDLALANLLMRPAIFYHRPEFQKEMAISKENYGSVPRVYLICENENSIKQGFQKRVIENIPCDEVKMISGADHMVMFSKPRELCSFLQEIAEKY